MRTENDGARKPRRGGRRGARTMHNLPGGAGGASPTTVGGAGTATQTPTFNGTTREVDVNPDDLTSTQFASEITWGLVNAYSVNSTRLMIKLDISAVRRALVSIQASSPQFRSAVSMTMLAHHNNDRLSVRYLTDPRFTLANDGLEILPGIEVGLGEDALSFEDWPFAYTGS